MSRWFRHYAGLMRDDKLVRVAVRSKQSVERVVWVWGAILESAAEVNDGGRYEIDAGEVAYFLRCDAADVDRILTGLADLGRVAQGVVVRWSDRQFESDTSRERQRRYRDRKKNFGNDVSGNGDAEMGQGDVTITSPDGQVTPQETETETDTVAYATDVCAREADDDWPKDWAERFWARYPNKVGKPKALAALAGHRKRKASFAAIMAGLDRYIRDKPPDRPWCNPQTWINQERWEDMPAEVIPFGRTTGAGNGLRETTDALRDAAAQLRAESETGFGFGTYGDDARLLSGPG